jgi:hypothetical protein
MIESHACPYPNRNNGHHRYGGSTLMIDGVVRAENAKSNCFTVLATLSEMSRKS